MEFLNELLNRNAALFYFGLLCLLCAVLCIVLVFVTDTVVLGINAWIKPAKFFISSWIFVWTMGWILTYLERPQTEAIYSWTVIIVMSFELVYIAAQAYRGQLSHFNTSDSFGPIMFSLMGVAISVMTVCTAYIGLLFFKGSYPELPAAYLWGIRFGILLFVIFAFEGGLMGSRMTHTIGGPDGESGLPFVNWSVRYGDLRIAHFVGMHALQVLPLMGFYVIHNSKVIIGLSIGYFLMAVFILVQALIGIPLIRVT